MMFYYTPMFWKFVSDTSGEYIFTDKREMNRVIAGLTDTKKGTVYHYVDGILNEEYEVEMFKSSADRWYHMEVKV